MEALRRTAGPTVEFLGRVSDRRMALEMATARALLFPGEEDFGITPVEAQAAGTPVIAYRRGGALETVVPPDGDDFGGATGLFFSSPTPESLGETLRAFDRVAHRFLPESAVQNAARFETGRYVRQMLGFLDAQWDGFRGRL
jgi:glycosyltransferase involved in cell wall biosynthesis